MERTSNHVVDDGLFREATINLQSTLLCVNQRDDVDSTILNVGSNSILKHASTIEALSIGQCTR